MSAVKTVGPRFSRIVKAIRYDGTPENIADIEPLAGYYACFQTPKRHYVTTQDGAAYLTPGDWIVCVDERAKQFIVLNDTAFRTLFRDQDVRDLGKTWRA